MIGPWQLLIVLVIVILLFGTKRLKNLGPDLGNAIKGFRGALKEGEKEAAATPDKLEDKADNTLANTAKEEKKDHS